MHGRPAGTWGDVGTLSFGGSKLLTAGRGGALLFRDAQLHQRATVFLHRGLQQWAPLSELQAAALRPQLRKLAEMTRRRAEMAQFLTPPSLLGKGVGGLGSSDTTLVPFGNLPPDSTPAFYKLGFRYDAAAFGLPREVFVRAMRAEGIAFDAGFKARIGPVAVAVRAAGELANATAAHERCVMLHHPILSLSQADVQQVADAVAKVYRAVIGGRWLAAGGNDSQTGPL